MVRRYQGVTVSALAAGATSAEQTFKSDENYIFRGVSVVTDEETGENFPVQLDLDVRGVKLVRPDANLSSIQREKGYAPLDADLTDGSEVKFKVTNGHATAARDIRVTLVLEKDLIGDVKTRTS